MGGASRSSRRTQQPPSNRPSRREPERLTHPRVISTATAVGIAVLVHAWYASLWISIPTGIIAALVFLIPADIISALRSMSKEDRQVLYARWTESFLDAMAMTAFAHPENCGPEMTEYVLQRYRERAAQKEDAAS